jgi:hypothetical protein
LFDNGNEDTVIAILVLLPVPRDIGAPNTPALSDSSTLNNVPVNTPVVSNFTVSVEPIQK